MFSMRELTVPVYYDHVVDCSVCNVQSEQETLKQMYKIHCSDAFGCLIHLRSHVAQRSATYNAYTRTCIGTAVYTMS